MALLSLQQIHKTFEKGTLSREILSLSLGEMVLVNQP